MPKTIVVRPNQSMLDVIIQVAGSIEAGIGFCTLNNVSISDTPAVGTVYEIPESPDVQSLSDQGVLKYLGQNGIIIGTLSIDAPAIPPPPPPPPLAMIVLLKPVMTASYMGAI